MIKIGNITDECINSFLHLFAILTKTPAAESMDLPITTQLVARFYSYKDSIQFQLQYIHVHMKILHNSDYVNTTQITYTCTKRFCTTPVHICALCAQGVDECMINVHLVTLLLLKIVYTSWDSKSSV